MQTFLLEIQTPGQFGHYKYLQINSRGAVSDLDKLLSIRSKCAPNSSNIATAPPALIPAQIYFYPLSLGTTSVEVL